MVKAAVLALALPLTGCGSLFYQQLVYVSDEEGRPVEGAAVSILYPSFSGDTARTNAAGVAPLSTSGVFDVLKIVVSSGGFVPQWVDPPSRWPLEVVLKRGGEQR